MKEPSLIVIGLVLCVAAAGCAAHDSPAEVRQKSEQAAARGQDKFNEELVTKSVTWYVGGGQPFSGFDAQSGLPEQAMSTGLADPFSADFVRGHNAAILKYMAQNGPVPGSFKPWENNLYHQAVYFDLHKDEQPQRMRLGIPIKSLDGQYTLVLQRSGASKSPITQSPFQLMVFSPAGQNETTIPAGASEPAAEVLFGPNGSDLAFTRWPASAGEPIYGALDLRDGRWLVVQRGSR